MDPDPKPGQHEVRGGPVYPALWRHVLVYWGFVVPQGENPEHGKHWRGRRARWTTVFYVVIAIVWWVSAIADGRTFIWILAVLWTISSAGLIYGVVKDRRGRALRS